MKFSTFSLLKQKCVELELPGTAPARVMDTRTPASNMLLEERLRKEVIKSDLKERGEIVSTDGNTSVPDAEVCLKAGQDNVISGWLSGGETLPEVVGRADCSGDYK